MAEQGKFTDIQRSTMKWRWTALILYLMICFYDFMFVPIWFGLNRPDLAQFIEILNTVEDPLIQLELMKKLTGQHNPFTLMGGGLFHLAFGAILTGSAFGAN
jgi:tryptophan-rich sensory protein